MMASHADHSAPNLVLDNVSCTARQIIWLEKFQMTPAVRYSIQLYIREMRQLSLGKWYRLLFFLDVHCRPIQERVRKGDGVKQRQHARANRVTGESVGVWERGEKTVDGKSSFLADFNLSTGWARRFRPHCSRQSRRVTASRAAGGGWGRLDLVSCPLCTVACVFACVWNMLCMLKRKWLSEGDGWTEKGWWTEEIIFLTNRRTLRHGPIIS